MTPRFEIGKTYCCLCDKEKSKCKCFIDKEKKELKVANYYNTEFQELAGITFLRDALDLLNNRDEDENEKKTAQQLIDEAFMIMTEELEK